MKAKTFLSVMALFILASPLLAFQNEPGGFRGMTWGQSFSSFKKGTFVSPRQPNSAKDLFFYNKKNDDLRVGNSKAKEIEYGFWKGQLSNVIASFPGPMGTPSIA